MEHNSKVEKIQKKNPKDSYAKDSFYDNNGNKKKEKEKKKKRRKLNNN
tara:strand:+ start:6999 stop:7142 length:144 start_codon:yes stop_codon:yes gene_type:complete